MPAPAAAPAYTDAAANFGFQAVAAERLDPGNLPALKEAFECFPNCVDAARPLRYPPSTAGEHIRQKIAATHRA